MWAEFWFIGYLNFWIDFFVSIITSFGNMSDVMILCVYAVLNLFCDDWVIELGFF